MQRLSECKSVLGSEKWAPGIICGEIWESFAFRGSFTGRYYLRPCTSKQMCILLLLRRLSLSGPLVWDTSPKSLLTVKASALKEESHCARVRLPSCCMPGSKSHRNYRQDYHQNFINSLVPVRYTGPGCGSGPYIRRLRSQYER